MITNLIFNKTKNASVRFFIYMSSMWVQLFTAFEEAVLKLYVGRKEGTYLFDKTTMYNTYLK